jgi:hypothetical protein
LDAAPEDERILHLMFGQLANDLNILTKILMYATNEFEDRTELSARANNAISILLIKQLAGRLNEGWNLIKKQFNPLYKKYEAELSDDSKQKLQELKNYFDRTNVVNKIRNQSAFHSDPLLAKEAYKLIPDNEVMVDFLSAYKGHSLYFSSELVSILGLIQLNPDAKTWQDAIDKIAKEVTGLTIVMTDFILGFMTVFAEKYISPHIGDIRDHKFSIDEGPSADTVSIPFFSSRPKD